MESLFLTVNGLRLHLLHWPGAGEPLVFFHGNSHCGGVWAALAEDLGRDGYDCYALDLRGHGQSEKPEEGYGWDRLRDDGTGVLDALDLRGAWLVGHSRGGGTALLAAAARPERVRGVLVYEPTVPLGLSRRPPGFVSERSTRALRRRTVFASRDAIELSYRERETFRSWDGAVLRAYIEHGTESLADGTVALRCPPRVEVALYEAMTDPSAWEGTQAGDLPVLAVFGERGGRVGDGRDPLAAIRQMFARAEMVVMPEATHFGPMERPAVFAEMMRGFARR